MDRINVGVIGTGWCGGIRADACFANPLVADLHIAETREERLREVEASAHPVTATTDYRVLLDNPDIAEEVEARLRIALGMVGTEEAASDPEGEAVLEEV